MAEPEMGDGFLADDFDLETLFATKPRTPPPPNVFTITIRVAPYVVKIDDGSEEYVERHDVVFDVNIAGGLSWVNFNAIVAQHIKMGPHQELKLFAYDRVLKTIDPMGNGQQLVMHLMNDQWDWEAKKSFLYADVVTLEISNAKKYGVFTG